MTPRAFGKSNPCPHIDLDACKVVQIWGNDEADELVAVIDTLLLNDRFEKAVEIFLHQVGGGE